VRRQIADLSGEYTVVAPDMRGYNLSDKPPRVEDYQIDNLADDVIGLSVILGFANAAVVGHDWGASVAWSIARKHPEYVWKLCAMQVPPIDVGAKIKLSNNFWQAGICFLSNSRASRMVLSRNDFACWRSV
jgi:pimeloyl-ACP methyl ester carboxylesterase